MNSRRTVTAVRWTLAFAALAGILLVYRYWLHVNPTTVALSLLLLILLLAAEWGLRYAVAVSIVATALYNFFFLPPVGTFVISDPQNWLALAAFLATAIIASRLAQRARDEANDARARQSELEVLFRLSRELLQSESIADLLATMPSIIASVTGARSGTIYLLDGDRLYQAGPDALSGIEIPDLRQRANSLPGAVFETGSLHVPLRTGVRPTGLVILHGVTLSPETADALGGLISISMDRVQALESVARGEAAKESERMRSLMMDSITHELRTPLTSIKGAATTLLGGQLNSEDSRELLTVINEESDRLNRLVSEAVEMAQLDTHQVQMHFVPVSISELIANAREESAWIEEQHPLRIHAPGDLAVQADPVFLQKVLCNLLENAAKYSRPGTPITVTAEHEGENIALSIADQGTGIEPAEQSLIFERFYRARSQAETTPGTGMGLAISRSIVEAHHGQLTVVSQAGKGSVFTLRLRELRS